MRLRPTALGWKAGLFFIALLGAFFAAPYSNLYFLLLVFLGCLGGLSVLWTRRNLKGVRAEVVELPPCPAGNPQPFTVRWTGPAKARFQLAFEIDLGTGGIAAARVTVLQGTTSSIGETPALPRGVHVVRRTDVSSTYPLGLVRARLRSEGPTEWVVYPTPAALPEARNSGELVAHLTGDLGGVAGSDQPSGLREFRSGDELRSVHWRASARKQHLVVKEWEGDAARGIEVVLDRRAEPAALEEALSLVSALALCARDDKECLTLHTQGLTATFGSDHRPWAELLRLLALAAVLPPGAAAPPSASPSVLRLPMSRTGARA